MKCLLLLPMPRLIFSQNPVLGYLSTWYQVLLGKVLWPRCGRHFLRRQLAPHHCGRPASPRSSQFLGASTASLATSASLQTFQVVPHGLNRLTTHTPTSHPDQQWFLFLGGRLKGGGEGRNITSLIITVALCPHLVLLSLPVPSTRTVFVAKRTEKTSLLMQVKLALGGHTQTITGLDGERPSKFLVQEPAGELPGC